MPSIPVKVRPKTSSVGGITAVGDSVISIITESASMPALSPIYTEYLVHRTKSDDRLSRADAAVPKRNLQLYVF